jgi:hypothetical protein
MVDLGCLFATIVRFFGSSDIAHIHWAVSVLRGRHRHPGRHLFFTGRSRLRAGRVRLVTENVESCILNRLPRWSYRLLHSFRLLLTISMHGRPSKWPDLRLWLTPGNITAVHRVAWFLLLTVRLGLELLRRIPERISRCSLHKYSMI